MGRFYRCNVLILAVVALAVPCVAFADAVSDGQTVASKLYVDTVTANSEVTTNKLDGGSGNTITANASNTTKYPSAKAVADYAQPKTGSGDNYKLGGASGTWVALGTTLDSSANGYVAANAVTAGTIVSALAAKQTKPATVANGQVLTYTGSDANANVSAGYIKVPVAAGAPSSNTPTAFSEIWLQ